MTKVYTISLELKVEAIIGILPHERQNPQLLEIDFVTCYETEDAKNYLDYSLIAKDITSLLQDNRYGLLEEATADILEQLKSKYSMIQNPNIEIKKPSILDNGVVGISLSLGC